MKTFTAAILASAVYARGNEGGIRQGKLNASHGARHGYGYNIGNDYVHGDSHLNEFGHQGAWGTPTATGRGADWGSNQYTAPDFHDHLTGYDSVQPERDDTDFTDADPSTMRVFADAINTEIDNVQADREAFIDDELDKRKDRLSEIHDDNLLKIEAPFDLQLDLLEEEREDII